MSVATLDRRVIRINADEPEQSRISAFRGLERYVLLGEPGIGKSTVFEQEAALADTEPVRALDFVSGTRPPGGKVFIDALEEYRIGEAGIDRLHSLIKALDESHYAGWRIACRAISLPPPDARQLRSKLGDYVTLQMDLLDPFEQRAMLAAAGEADPTAFVERIRGFGADALLGNPATLLLLKNTIEKAKTPLDTRDALFAEAASQMSHETNPDLPERPGRPASIQIEAAAEAACLVLLLSAREDLWMYSTSPPHDWTVTRGDLLPAQIDTDALRAAVDTPMFKSDSVTFQPSHRVVAEYLAGRALARAVVPTDPATPALPLYRALAFCNGDNDRPAPALTGVFAWFVTALSKSRLSDRATDLVRLDPEAILFHGDAAALLPMQRAVLLDILGRGDPWFLGAARGSSAIGGLAGEDLADRMRAILESPTETPHRRTMVLEALATGRPVRSLAEVVRTLATKPASGHFMRRRAVDAYLHIVGETPSEMRRLLDDIAGEPAETASEIRAELAAGLVRADAIGVDEVRRIIADYAGTGDQVMGYARVLGEALVKRPLPGLFDEPMAIPTERGVARSFEVRSLINRVLAAAIAATASLDAERLLDWLANVGIDDDDRVDDGVQAAVARWLDQRPDGEDALFQAIHKAITKGSDRLWRVDFDFSRLSGREISEGLRVRAIAAVERESEPAKVGTLAQLAFYLVQPFEKRTALYWRLFAALEGRTGGEQWLAALTASPVEEWRGKHARRRKKAEAESESANAKDREWLKPHVEGLRDGSLVYALGYASDIYSGYRGSDGSNGVERVTSWLAADADLISAVREGWGRVLQAQTGTPHEEGRATAVNQWPTSELIVVAWADWRLRDGLALDLSLPLAFRLLRHSYAIDDNADALRTAALTRIYADPDGGEALHAFWSGAIEAGGDDLPQAHYLDANELVVREATRMLLVRSVGIPSDALCQALGLAAASMAPMDILALSEAALGSSEPSPARPVWALTAFILDPARHAGLLATELADAESQSMLGGMWEGRLGPLVTLANDKIVARSEALIRHLGPSHAPSRRLNGPVERISEVVGSAITHLSQQPTEEATEAFARLIAASELDAWHDTLQHYQAQQHIALRATRFTPPQPRAVALALAAGPPASPADLRGVVRHTLDELANDIRHGDTSPWRAFWNRPTGGKATPKVENDCRDLLTDRLRDRLERYGIPVRRTGTETRNAGDRRADMLILGEGSAALPIEVKRHWNRELWTAVTDQLLPYTRSAGSNGHGIYLVFWFGTAGRQLPALPNGGALPNTPGGLRSMLVDGVPNGARETISVIVIDVSEPPLTPTQVKNKARPPKAKSAQPTAKAPSGRKALRRSAQAAPPKQ